MKKEISVYIKPCFVGKVLVAETNQGICSVLFGDDDASMMNELKAIFPSDTITMKTGEASNIIVDVIDNGRSIKDLKLDIRTGTDLQQLVWLNILKIPKGSTMTYKELAKATGAPKAWRAVASACAKNVIAFIIPCHRVVSTNGDKMNYRWGSERKKKLLEREKIK